MRLNGVEWLCRGVITILDLGSVLVKEKSKDMREEKNNRKAVKQQTTVSSRAEEISELGYYRNRKTGSDVEWRDASCATILSPALFSVH